MPASFLMQQMEWREALEDASSAAALEALSDEVQAARLQLLQQCEALLDGQQAYAQAVEPVRALMFIEKFTQDVNQRFEQFE